METTLLVELMDQAIPKFPLKVKLKTHLVSKNMYELYYLKIYV